MKIFIAGIDGYIGWPLSLKQLAIGNEVCGIDNFSRPQHGKCVTPSVPATNTPSRNLEPSSQALPFSALWFQLGMSRDITKGRPRPRGPI